MSKRNWKFSQCFGDDGQIGEVSEADVLSAVEFDHSGEYLATGDKGGCMCIFRRNSSADDVEIEDEVLESPSKTGGFWKKSKTKGTPTAKERAALSKRKTALQFNFYAEFQSHEPEFDYLKSLEKIKQISELNLPAGKNSSGMNMGGGDSRGGHRSEAKWATNGGSGRGGRVSRRRGGDKFVTRTALKVPKLVDGECVVAAYNRRKFCNAHAYHINSVSVCSDGETFISADDLRINLWNMNRAGQSFNIVDIKPENMEMLTEVITAAEFHPHDCNIFMYSSSCGKINVGDLRQQAICGNKNMKCLMEPEDPSTKSFFSEIIASISHVCFTPCGKYAVSRDYLSLKIWDLAMESRPVRTVNINEHLRPKLCDLYENDCIFDKFEFAVGRNNGILTGTYDNNINVYDNMGKEKARLRIGGGNVGRKRSNSGFKFGKRRGSSSDDFAPPNIDEIDFSQKILHVALNPKRDVCAIAAKSQLFMYGVF
eukprot:g1675.t1